MKRSIFLTLLMTFGLSAQAQMSTLNFTWGSYDSINKCSKTYPKKSEAKSRCFLEVLNTAQVRDLSVEEGLEFRACMEGKNAVALVSGGTLTQYLQLAYECHNQ